MESHDVIEMIYLIIFLILNIQREGKDRYFVSHQVDLMDWVDAIEAN